MTAPVYLILSPALRGSDQWMLWRRELALLLPGTQFVCWENLPAGFLEVPAPERPARLARAFSAAVVIPEKHGPRIVPRRLGRVAAAEAGAFHTAGKPVHVYAAGVLIPWAACQLREARKGPRYVPLELLTPQLIKAARTKAGTPRPLTAPERRFTMAQLSEAELLAEITGLCEQRGIWLVHNDNPHHSRRRQNLAGFPDLILCGTYRVMYRELKSPMGQPTPRQTSWIKRLKGAGQDADVWRPRDLRSGRIGRELDMLGVPPPPPSERDLIDAEFARALA